MFRLDRGIFQDSLLAFLRELVDTVGFDMRLGTKTKLFFDFDFDPQPLAIESVLIAQIVSGHGSKSLEHVFIGPAPRMMNAHRIIRRHRSVEKTPRLSSRDLFLELGENRTVDPVFQDFVLSLDKLSVSDFFKHQIS